MWQNNNENVVSTQPAAHQRNKSMGNGKTMATIGTLNAPPKRTAFMDVSNVGNMVRPVVESKNKGVVKNQVKTLVSAINSRDVRPTDKENKATVLASKPLNAAPKTILGSIAAVSSNKPVVRSVASSIPATGTYHDRASVKPGPKKMTTTSFVYKQEVTAAAGQVEIVATQVVDKSAKNPRHYKSQPQLSKLSSDQQQPVLRRTQSRFLPKVDKIVDVEHEADVPDDATEAAYEDAVEQFQDNKFAGAPAAHEAGAAVRSYDYSVPAHMDHKSLPGSVGAPEPEEYWDEDDEQEYEVEGYTTAHSYRSHGDNTTVGATTLVAPKMTSMVEKELQMAKEIVQESLTEEEIEDEAWDISMVAEYAEEIVEYMRDLEVCLAFF